MQLSCVFLLLLHVSGLTVRGNNPDLDHPSKNTTNKRAIRPNRTALVTAKEARKWQTEYDNMLKNHSLKLGIALRHVQIPILQDKFNHDFRPIGFVINLDRDKWQWETALHMFSEFHLFRVPALELTDR